MNIFTIKVMFEKIAWTFYLDSICFQSALLSCGMSWPACCLFLTLRSLPKEYVVHKGVFQQGQEHKHKAPHQVNIYCLDIGNLWQGLPEVGADGGHGQHSRDSCKKKKKSLTSKTSRRFQHKRHNHSIAFLMQMVMIWFLAAKGMCFAELERNIYLQVCW